MILVAISVSGLMRNGYVRLLAFFFLTLPALVANAAGTTSVLRLDPALDRLVSSDARIETVYTGKAGDSFEGPVWIHNAGLGYLVFTNVPGNEFYKLMPDGTVSVFLDHIFTGDPATAHRADTRVMIGANGATLDRQGRLVYASYSAGQIVRVEKNGDRTVLAGQFDGKRINAPNDVVVKSDGSVYFTDSRMSTERTSGPNCDKFWLLCGNKDGLPYKGVYFVKGGVVHLLSKAVDHPNGLVFSPNEKYLYVSNSFLKNVLRYDMQPDGTGTNETVFIDMSSEPGDGLPDGIKVDIKGNVYCTGPGGVWIMSPTGKHLGTIMTPEGVPRFANFAFGGSDARTLYIEGIAALYRISLKTPGLRP